MNKILERMDKEVYSTLCDLANNNMCYNDNIQVKPQANKKVEMILNNGMLEHNKKINYLRRVYAFYDVKVTDVSMLGKNKFAVSGYYKDIPIQIKLIGGSNG